MRLLLLGDFSGRGVRRVEHAATLPEPRLHRVDLDTLERVLAGIAPQVLLPADPGGTATVLEFSSLDDFHPDRLFERVAIFGRFRALRARLLDPLTFDAAAAELCAQGLARRDASETSPTAAMTESESDSGTLQRLLGHASPARAETRPSAPPIVDALIRRLVAPHVAPDSARHRSVYLQAVDAAIGEQMRRLLHAPGFRTVEIAWRSVQWLVSRLELNEDLQLHLLDVTREQLEADLLAAQRDPSRTGLARILCSAGAGEDPHWALLTGLFSVGPSVDELRLLSALGALAAQSRAPIVAAATPALFGCKSVADLPDPLQWQPLASDVSEIWSGLRHSAVSQWIGLVAPRFLLRLPYGKATEPVERFAFEEQPAVPVHETLLWGPGSLAVALLIGQGFAEGGWERASNPASDLEELPAYSFRRDGEVQLQPCAEAWVGEQAGQALLDRGLMPLLSDRQAARVRLLRMQSVSDPVQPLARPWA